jgi:hypothetical protein
MPKDAKEAIGHGIRAKRSKSGALSFEQPCSRSSEISGHTKIAGPGEHWQLDRYQPLSTKPLHRQSDGPHDGAPGTTGP